MGLRSLHGLLLCISLLPDQLWVASFQLLAFHLQPNVLELIIGNGLSSRQLLSHCLKVLCGGRRDRHSLRALRQADGRLLVRSRLRHHLRGGRVICGDHGLARRLLVRLLSLHLWGTPIRLTLSLGLLGLDQDHTLHSDHLFHDVRG